MKKILFLILFFFIKLNAYEYKLYEEISSIGNSNRYFFYTDSGGHLWIKRVTQNGDTYNYNNYYYPLNNIKYGNHKWWITTGQFRVYFTNDLKLLNDLFVQMPNAMLNYFYNSNSFSNSNYINYDNYELLYNSDGLAVESIVDGVWAGLYSDSDRSSSGRLYNSSGVLVYVNAEPVSTFEKWLDPIVRSVVGCLMTSVNLISSPIGVVISVVFVMAILYFVVWLGRKSLRVKDGL